MTPSEFNLDELFLWGHTDGGVVIEGVEVLWWPARHHLWMCNAVWTDQCTQLELPTGGEILKCARRY